MSRRPNAGLTQRVRELLCERVAGGIRVADAGRQVATKWLAHGRRSEGLSARGASSGSCPATSRGEWSGRAPSCCSRRSGSWPRRACPPAPARGSSPTGACRPGRR